MSHVFISYSHKDGEKHLRNLISKLKEDGFDEAVWIDHNDILSGEDWRLSIDDALATASCVVIVVTPEAIKSHFVTYEWAWAVGNGTNVVPLLFETTSQDPHPLHDRQQYIDCREEIPNDLSSRLKQFSKMSSLEFLLGRRVSDLCMPLRILSFFTIWLHQFAIREIVSYREFHRLAEQNRDITHDLYYNKLPEFWFDRASAFTKKQTLQYKSLIAELDVFWDKWNDIAFETQYFYRRKSQDYTALVDAIAKYSDENIDRLIEFFLADRSDYTHWKMYLETIANQGFAISSPFVAAAIRHIPEHERNNILRLIDTIIAHRSTNLQENEIND
ncbi:MAG: toll/interleukin-1 receptor domain-containing protein [Anaerolineae bacterium]|nr:toll/interleukin-1 receptor domain-containing protein [Anaerolineae bacterium]